MEKVSLLDFDYILSITNKHFVRLLNLRMKFAQVVGSELESNYYISVFNNESTATKLVSIIIGDKSVHTYFSYLINPVIVTPEINVVNMKSSHILTLASSLESFNSSQKLG
jgi:hypothetical protein